MDNKAVKALGLHYFEEESFPFNICRIERDEDITHEFDLTEIEHYHDFNELVFILKGQGVQVIEQNEYLVSAGDVFVLQGNQRHFFKDASGIEIVNVMFSPNKKFNIISPTIQKLEGYNALFILESQYRAQHHFKNKLHLDRSELAKMEFILNSMIMEYQHKLEGFKTLLSNKLDELIVLLSRHYSSLEATEARSLVRIGKVIDFLENNFADKIYTDQLAEMAFMSPRNFQRIFRKAVGETPTNYIMQIRLQKARKLLRNTESAIAEIAIDTGFGDSNYFIKCFKKEFSITPVKFRMRYRS
ncbi:MAG: helix-turn-helix domain-containing protein [Salinivirgaceae bacterium]|jgi:AraC-like DNA-binding protein/mannose-6-phosphate isomerase-like protein (cupin superfamily)|nr:helix-turn-helix domain-containing protein [Salinivirgaceae bacterium]